MKKSIECVISMMLCTFILIPKVYAIPFNDKYDDTTTYDVTDYYTLTPLPYAANALEPYIDSTTMTLHHEKHEQGYVNNLNAAINQAPALKSKAIEELLSNPKQVPKELRTKVLNNAGGVYNHNFFWNSLCPNGGGKPMGNIGDAIVTQFGSFENFKIEFEKSALNVFGSGWVWLLADNKGNLYITTTANQDTPVPLNKIPILNLDLWEHGYYLKYQNRRNEYISAFWNIVNWDFAENNYLEGFKK